MCDTKSIGHRGDLYNYMMCIKLELSLEADNLDNVTDLRVTTRTLQLLGYVSLAQNMVRTKVHLFPSFYSFEDILDMARCVTRRLESLRFRLSFGTDKAEVKAQLAQFPEYISAKELRACVMLLGIFASDMLSKQVTH